MQASEISSSTTSIRYCFSSCCSVGEKTSTCTSADDTSFTTLMSPTPGMMFAASLSFMIDILLPRCFLGTTAVTPPVSPQEINSLAAVYAILSDNTVKMPTSDVKNV